MLAADILLQNWPYVLVGLLALIIALQSIAIARGDQFITVERRWFGRQMADGRTVALGHEVGVQARTLGPGVHVLIPFIYKVTKHRFIAIGSTQIGIVRAVTGQPMAAGHFFARTVDCNIFQDGEAFLQNGGEKGPQLMILPPGEYPRDPGARQVDR
jgi:uncharacterized membrane protein YqiK